MSVEQRANPCLLQGNTTLHVSSTSLSNEVLPHSYERMHFDLVSVNGVCLPVESKKNQETSTKLSPHFRAKTHSHRRSTAFTSCRRVLYKMRKQKV